VSGRTHFLTSSSIIEHVRAVFDTGGCYLAYFFFDFKDVAKQDNRALLSSLITQLSTQSDTCFEKLFHTYSKHGGGSQQPSERALLQCLKDMLVDLGHAPIYVIIDVVDECPNTSKAPGAPRSRREVLETIKELVKLGIPNLHVCITSRPELDIRNTVKQLARLVVSLQDQDGQKDDIAAYVHSTVYSDNEEVMTRWGEELKERVVQTLSCKADGM
jgi:hypothetical protein